MQHVETTISAAAVHVRLADTIDPAKSTQWVDVQFPLEALKHPTNGTAITEPADQFLGELQGAALGRALQVIQAEIRRLKNAASANP
jgi:hypothetical protein